MTNELQESNESAKICYICKEKSQENMLKRKNIAKLETIIIIPAQSLYSLKYSVPKEIPIVFHNGSNYDYHFIIKKLTE